MLIAFSSYSLVRWPLFYTCANAHFYEWENIVKPLKKAMQNRTKQANLLTNSYTLYQWVEILFCSRIIVVYTQFLFLFVKFMWFANDTDVLNAFRNCALFFQSNSSIIYHANTKRLFHCKLAHRCMVFTQNKMHAQ